MVLLSVPLHITDSTTIRTKQDMSITNMLTSFPRSHFKRRFVERRTKRCCTKWALSTFVAMQLLLGVGKCFPLKIHRHSRLRFFNKSFWRCVYFCNNMTSRKEKEIGAWWPQTSRSASNRQVSYLYRLSLHYSYDRRKLYCAWDLYPRTLI